MLDVFLGALVALVSLPLLGLVASGTIFLLLFLIYSYIALWVDILQMVNVLKCEPPWFVALRRKVFDFD